MGGEVVSNDLGVVESGDCVEFVQVGYRYGISVSKGVKYGVYVGAGVSVGQDVNRYVGVGICIDVFDIFGSGYDEEVELEVLVVVDSDYFGSSDKGAQDGVAVKIYGSVD